MTHSASRGGDSGLASLFAALARSEIAPAVIRTFTSHQAKRGLGVRGPVPGDPTSLAPPSHTGRVNQLGIMQNTSPRIHLPLASWAMKVEVAKKKSGRVMGPYYSPYPYNSLSQTTHPHPPLNTEFPSPGLTAVGQRADHHLS